MKTLYPVAQHLLNQTGGNDHGRAWRTAILRERKLCGKDSCRDVAAILVRHFAFNFSTSAVERLFPALNKKSVFQSSQLSHHDYSIAKVFQICLDEWNTTWWCWRWSLEWRAPGCFPGSWWGGAGYWPCTTWMGRLACELSKTLTFIVDFMCPFFKAVFFIKHSKARVYGDARRVWLSSLIVKVKDLNSTCYLLFFCSSGFSANPQKKDHNKDPEFPGWDWVASEEATIGDLSGIMQQWCPIFHVCCTSRVIQIVDIKANKRNGITKGPTISNQSLPQP